MNEDQLRQLMVADRTRDLEVITTVIDHILVDLQVSPLDVEIALRSEEANTYLVAHDGELSIVLGEDNWRDILAQLDLTPEVNRAALAELSKD